MQRRKYLHSIFNITLVAIGIGLFHRPANAQQPCQELINSCQYYACKNTQLRCADKNYLYNFGYKNCVQFEIDRHFFSTQGQQFLDRVRPCLQNKIEQENPEQFICPNVENYVYDHHVQCYIENGYCELNAEDKQQITIEVHGSLISNPQLFQTAIKIQHKCRTK